jgi:hypothetical protein
VKCNYCPWFNNWQKAFGTSFAITHSKNNTSCPHFRFPQNSLAGGSKKKAKNSHHVSLVNPFKSGSSLSPNCDASRHSTAPATVAVGGVTVVSLPGINSSEDFDIGEDGLKQGLLFQGTDGGLSSNTRYYYTESKLRTVIAEMIVLE